MLPKKQAFRGPHSARGSAPRQGATRCPDEREGMGIKKAETRGLCLQDKGDDRLTNALAVAAVTRVYADDLTFVDE